MHHGRISRVTPPIDLSQLEQLIAVAEDEVCGKSGCFEHICQAFEREEPSRLWLQRGGIWLFPTRLSVLDSLRSTFGLPIGKSMKEAIIKFSVSIIKWQRLLRIQDAQRRRKHLQFEEELENPGHTNWDPNSYPDWLLLEIDANVLVRPIQADVAFAIISPASASNSVLQLNMGKG